jgi:predicted Kef-type K+ transport protein
VFFAMAGLRMDLTLLADPSVLLAGIAVLVIAIGSKFTGAYLGARLSRLTHWEAFALGAGLNARGVIEVIVASVGVKLGVLNTASYTIVVLVAIVTSMMTPPLLRMAMSRVQQTAEEELRLEVQNGVAEPTPRGVPGSGLATDRRGGVHPGPVRGVRQRAAAGDRAAARGSVDPAGLHRQW